MKEFLCKSDSSITLKEHSIIVSKQIDIITKTYNITDIKIIKAAKCAALFHDIGKTSKCFQDKLKNLEISKQYPRHSEIGYGLMKLIIDKNYGFFDENSWIDLVEDVVLYHHDPYNIEMLLSEIYTNEEIFDIIEYYNIIIKELGLEDYVRLKDEINVEDDDIIVGNKKNLNTILDGENKENLKRQTNFELIFKIVRESDRIASSMNDITEDNFIKQFPEIEFVFPEHYDKNRWEEQLEVAQKAMSMKNSVVEATMGWGKTQMGVFYLLKLGKRGFWVCPDNTICTSTYRNILKILNDCKIFNVKVCLIINGKYIGDSYVNADIIVTNIDTITNDIFRNLRKDISYDFLFSNCIFDEFHEYALTDTPLLSRFLTINNARKKIESVNTMLMSGTIINNGFINVDENNIIKAEKSNLAKEKKVYVKFIEYNDMLAKIENKEINDFFIINTNIDTAQQFFLNDDIDVCYHSDFDTPDKNRIFDEIINNKGKTNRNNDYNVTATSIISRGVDVSFNNCILINPNPITIVQSTGRVNRYDINNNGTVYIVIKDNKGYNPDISIYDVYQRNNNKFYRNNNNVWDKYYKLFLLWLKDKINDKLVSIEDLNNFRIKFFEKLDKNVSFAKLIKENLNKSFSNLSKIDFRKGTRLTNKINDILIISDKIDVRGDNISRFFIVQKDNEEFGIMSDIINIPYYRFGDSSFSELYNNEIINNIKKFFYNNPELCKKYGIKNLNHWKNGNNFIRFLLDKSKSSETPFPILCNYGYNGNTIGFYKKNKKK